MMSAAKIALTLPAPYTGIELYVDLSKMTLLNRKKLVSITKALHNNNIGGFPTKLSIKRQGRSHTVRSMKAGLALLKEWRILPADDHLPTSDQPHHMKSDWS